MEKNNVVSDKAEKSLAAKLQKEEQSTQFAGVDGKGRSIDGFPLIPVGSVIFLKWNKPEEEETKIIGVKHEHRQSIDPYWTVIGIGGTVKTVDLGDKLILKADTQVESYITDDLGIPEFKYHKIYEHNIFAIVK